jgi:hypothetical protein
LSVAVTPETLSVYVPAGVLTEVVTVSVEEPDPETEAGTKEAEAPEGKPLTEKLTVSVKSFNAVTDTVYGALPPCTVARDDGDADIEKSGGGFTITFRVGGLGSVTLALSVTVRVAVYVPADE